ncbi:MAG: hypothetical protein CVV49_00105 [Spirochaetae bacterium HGW-Spirochaetae-5]|nr:MAG: hypothetical protein CVV49_00105 [Spirochaetae bacterium HGW-Spirochaetae-5]
MTIDRKYIDITSLRNWFSNNDPDFNSKLAVSKVLTFGLSDGKTKTASMAVLFALTSHVQYLLKRNGVTVVSWWYAQHIILSYLKESILRGYSVTPENSESFITEIMKTKTDQGETAFSRNGVLQILQAIYKFRTDSLIGIIYNYKTTQSAEANIYQVQPITPVLPPEEKETIYNDEIEIEIENDNKKNSGMNPLLIIGGLTAGVLLLSNKKKRK